MKSKIGVFVGSFDPFHDGHFYVYQKAHEIFDEVYILVANHPLKKSASLFQRRSQILEYFLYRGIRVKVFITTGLTTTFLKRHDIPYLIRGIRNNDDLVYEQALKKLYQKHFPNLEVIYIRTNESLKDLTSSSLRKI